MLEGTRKQKTKAKDPLKMQEKNEMLLLCAVYKFLGEL